MPRQKRYYRRSRIPEAKFCEVVRYFAADLSATEAANLTGLTRKSVTGIFLKLRQRIAENCERESPLATPEAQHDEALSCTRCLCGRCRDGSSYWTPVFGLIGDGGKIFTAAVPDCRKPILRAIIRGSVDTHSMPVNGWHGYDALVDAENPRPFVVDQERATEGGKSVENFWNFARQRLQKFNGVPNRTFYFHMKESEWRFNHDRKGLYSELLKLIENNPL
ncbi:MAG: IS1595 family transposase [Pyrinomonadaceae bacterium]